MGEKFGKITRNLILDFTESLPLHTKGSAERPAIVTIDPHLAFGSDLDSGPDSL
jgi:hypothetical protein